MPSKLVEGVVYGHLFIFSPPTRASQFSEQTAIDDRPKPMPSSLNYPTQGREGSKYLEKLMTSFIDGPSNDYGQYFHGHQSLKQNLLPETTCGASSHATQVCTECYLNYEVSGHIKVSLQGSLFTTSKMDRQLFCQKVCQRTNENKQ